jgi:hypothetical protein
MKTKRRRSSFTSNLKSRAGSQPDHPDSTHIEGYDTTAASLGYKIVTENLAYMTIDPAYVVNAAWQGSPFT